MASSRLWKALSESSAQTSENAADARLRGRTYLVPFATVWDEIITMIETDPRWKLIRADEGAGLIRAEATSRVFRLVGDVRFKLRLDRNALTRVDIRSASRVGKGDLGGNARRIARFCRRLDRRLGIDG
ncbi:MAG: DUF1499 domain-containing protein [Gemmatimonadales bacterium]|jgi:uncharacterized protein (DUF1499 family)